MNGVSPATFGFRPIYSEAELAASAPGAAHMRPREAQPTASAPGGWHGNATSHADDTQGELHPPHPASSDSVSTASKQAA